jgi:hypothetical protein
MTADECIKWVQGRIAAFMPSDDMGDSGIAVRLPQLINAAASVEMGKAFGFTFPQAIREESIARATPLIKHAVDQWGSWLVAHLGEEGSELFERATRILRPRKPSVKALREDAEIAQAFAGLRASLADTEAATREWRKRNWLTKDEAHGYAIAPPLERAGELLGEFELDSEALPSALEALYREMDGLWTWPVASPGGQRPFDSREEYFVFMPLEGLLLHHDDRADEGLIILNQDPDFRSWTMLSRRDGAIYHATRFDGAKPPKKIASTLVEYLKQLATSYGSF